MRPFFPASPFPACLWTSLDGRSSVAASAASLQAQPRLTVPPQRRRRPAAPAHWPARGIAGRPISSALIGKISRGEAPGACTACSLATDSGRLAFEALLPRQRRLHGLEGRASSASVHRALPFAGSGPRSNYVASVNKALTSTLVGIALEQRRQSVDARTRALPSPQRRRSSTSAQEGSLTFRHLLQHAGRLRVGRVEGRRPQAALAAPRTSPTSSSRGPTTGRARDGSTAARPQRRCSRRCRPGGEPPGWAHRHFYPPARDHATTSGIRSQAVCRRGRRGCSCGRGTCSRSARPS